MHSPNLPKKTHTHTEMVGFSKEEKTMHKVVTVIPRWMKTLFFLISMLISLLLFSAPILLIIADALLPSAFLFPSSLSSHLNHYDFRFSLVDIPLISIIRSAIIFCVYSLCDGPRLGRGPYLATVKVCSAASVVLVSLKGAYIFIISRNSNRGGGYGMAMEVGLFVSSVGLAMGHVVVAHRISFRERRKLLLYKIDIEAICACKNGFPRYYQKTLQDSRTKLVETIFDRFQFSPDPVKFQVHAKDGRLKT